MGKGAGVVTVYFFPPPFSFSSCFVLVDYTRAYTKVLVL